MTRTVVPQDMEKVDRFTPAFFAQARSICKAQTRFRNAGYQRKLDKRKGKEGKAQRLPSVYCTPDINRLELVNHTDLDKERYEKALEVQKAIAAGKPLPIEHIPPPEVEAKPATTEGEAGASGVEKPAQPAEKPAAPVASSQETKAAPAS